MSTLQHVVRSSGAWSGIIAGQAVVSLPPPPWDGGFEIDDRAETMPRTPAIRGSHTWRNDPVLVHASKRKDRG